MDDVTKHNLIDEELLKAVEVIQRKQAQMSDATIEEREAFIEALVTHPTGTIRPRTWGMTTVSPYYKERYARELQLVLDEMFEDKTSDRKFLYADFNLASRSFYIRINQSWRYLIDKLDSVGKYDWMKKNVRIRRESDGLRLIWVHNLSTLAETDAPIEKPKTLTIKHEEVTPTELWKVKLNKFFEEAPEGDVFHAKSVDISPSDLANLTTTIEMLEDIQVIKLTTNEVKLYKGKLPEE